jgi:hypothetical protein
MSGPDTWGPHGWKFIHYVTLGYPNKPTKEDKIIYKKFLTSIEDVLPCILCKNNYSKHLKMYPLTDFVLKSRLNLMTWGIKMHNLVNMENNKKEVPMKDGISKIKNENDTCVNNHDINYVSVKTSKLDRFINLSPMIVFGIILLYQLFKMYCKKKDI